jgi:serine/threonine protein kinase
MLEYIPGGLLFDMCQTLGVMGEDAGRFFMTQMLDVLKYMHQLGVVHRDIKLENILVDDQQNFKLADFGFATFKNVTKLNDYVGTKTYMAPEIKECKEYDGRQVDVFALGVVLFVIVQGTFPFQEAVDDDYYYDLLKRGKLEKYFKSTRTENLSDEFKDLVVKMFSHDPTKRPTIKEIIEHPWMQ